ncbi:MAG: hypothetical protein HC889_13825, partial [Synechococcaceae cyanobacterium SM1_2_3]|nr:hypothetical protein [Synechococcaceae cyanobacterium SM1_2_3]
ESAALARAAAERLAAKRAAMEKVAMEKLAQEKAAVEQAIAEWAAAEHAEAERANLRKASTEQRDADAAEARLRAVEEAISEWIEDEREGHRTAAITPGRPTAEKTSTRTAAIHQQVRSAIEVIDKETGELDFIKNRIEAGVDLLPIEFRLTVDEWKEGKTLRQSSFDDLKQKFRYKAYSIEDGYELLHLYNQWLAQQRQKVRVFIQLLGVDVDRHDSMLGAIEHLERLEREKYLEMDVDVIYTLRDMRDMLDKLVRVETILRDLDGVCRKRSEQIIAPEWEAKGSL